jgi:hypothetical protein
MSVDFQRERKFLNAEGAKVTQKTQKRKYKIWLFLFCGLCEVFATSAFWLFIDMCSTLGKSYLLAIE